MPEISLLLNTAASGLASGMGAGALFWWMLKRNERRSEQAHDQSAAALNRVAGMERVCRAVRRARESADRQVLVKLERMDTKLDRVADRVARIEGRLNGGGEG